MPSKVETLRDILTGLRLSQEIDLAGDERAAVRKTLRIYLRAELGLPESDPEEDKILKALEGFQA